jgi:uncharacterized membrane protein YcaP (DUF421 family)
MAVDWGAIFGPRMSVLELLVRGTVMYLALFSLLRILVRRHVGSWGIADLLVIVLIADAAQHGMAGEHQSITEGLILCATIIGWSYLLDWLAYRSRRIRRLLEPEPLIVIRDGSFEAKKMERELITRDEVESQLRQHGVEDPSTVRVAFVEPDGQFSVFRNARTEVIEEQKPRPRRHI